MSLPRCVAHRRSFDEAMHDAWLAAPLNMAVTSLLVVDVDHFKMAGIHHIGIPGTFGVPDQAAQGQGIFAGHRQAMKPR